jgi:hypothetical protein
LPPVVIQLPGLSESTSITLFSQSSHLIFSLFVTDSMLGKMLEQKQQLKETLNDRTSSSKFQSRRGEI